MSTAARQVEFDLVRGSAKPQSTILAIGGGKGGIGKSFISTSLAAFLAQLGKRTVIVDLDIGAANAHTALGLPLVTTGVNEFLQSDSTNLEPYLTSTPFPRLQIISGASEFNGVADINEIDKSRLMSAIYRLDADYIVLDLSAGSHGATLDFFLCADHKIAVFTPDPSSIENAYRFLKAAFYKKLKRHELQLGLQDVLNEIMRQKDNYGVRSPADLFKAVKKLSPDQGSALVELMRQQSFELILNQTRSIADVDLGPSILNVCNRYFGVPCRYLGHVEHDNAVWQALRRKRHLILEYPNSRAYAQILGLAKKLISFTPRQTMVGS